METRFSTWLRTQLDVRPSRGWRGQSAAWGRRPSPASRTPTPPAYRSIRWNRGRSISRSFAHSGPNVRVEVGKVSVDDIPISDVASGGKHPDDRTRPAIRRESSSDLQRR